MTHRRGCRRRRRSLPPPATACGAMVTARRAPWSGTCTHCRRARRTDSRAAAGSPRVDGGADGFASAAGRVRPRHCRVLGAAGVARTPRALRSRARAVPGARVLARSHHAAVIAHGKLGDADAALALFHELPDLLSGEGAAADEAAAARSRLAYNAALIACTSCAEHGRAADLVAQMRAEGVPLNPLTYTAAIAAAQTLGKPDEALALFEEMQSQAVGQLDVGRVGWDWRNALDLLAQARGARLPMRAAAFNEALGACVRAQQWEAALALLEQMSSAGVPRDATTLGLAAQTAAGRGDWRMAATLLTELGTVADAPPPDAAVAAALEACAEQREWRAALAILRGDPAAADAPPPPPPPGGEADAAVAAAVATARAEAAAAGADGATAGAPRAAPTLGSRARLRAPRARAATSREWRAAVALFDERAPPALPGADAGKREMLRAFAAGAAADGGAARFGASRKMRGVRWQPCATLASKTAPRRRRRRARPPGSHGRAAARSSRRPCESGGGAARRMVRRGGARAGPDSSTSAVGGRRWAARDVSHLHHGWLRKMRRRRRGDGLFRLIGGAMAHALLNAATRGGGRGGGGAAARPSPRHPPRLRTGPGLRPRTTSEDAFHALATSAARSRDPRPALCGVRGARRCSGQDAASTARYARASAAASTSKRRRVRRAIRDAARGGEWRLLLSADARCAASRRVLDRRAGRQPQSHARLGGGRAINGLARARRLVRGAAQACRATAAPSCELPAAAAGSCDSTPRRAAARRQGRQLRRRKGGRRGGTSPAAPSRVRWKRQQRRGRWPQCWRASDGRRRRRAAAARGREARHSMAVRESSARPTLRGRCTPRARCPGRRPAAPPGRLPSTSAAVAKLSPLARTRFSTSKGRRATAAAANWRAAGSAAAAGGALSGGAAGARARRGLVATRFMKPR